MDQLHLFQIAEIPQIYCRSITDPDGSRKAVQKQFQTCKAGYGRILDPMPSKRHFLAGGYRNSFFEENEKISILPKAKKQPLTPEDMKITVLPQRPQVTVILDGKILHHNLQYAGKDDKWLSQELKRQHLQADEIFLGLCDNNGILQVYMQIEDFPSGDIFI